ncbi:hypothetical protein [Desulfocicer vacuolatum]|nr:hypothetical protein [Desulfocicer vacuolatum]
MKFSSNQRRNSSFVVGRNGSKYGLPVAVMKKMERFLLNIFCKFQ